MANSQTKMHVIKMALVTMVAGLVVYVASFGPMWSIMVRVPGSEMLKARVFWTIYQPFPETLRRLWFDVWREVDPEVRMHESHET